MTGSDYHGIIIKESLRDRSLFGRIQVLGQKQGRDWTLLKVGVWLGMIDRIIDLVQANLIAEKDVPYYAHFYRANELIVVFPKRIFHVSPDKTSWGEVIAYGESVGIPHNELDFRPCRIRDETY